MAAWWGWLLPVTWGLTGALAYAGAAQRYRRLRLRRWPVRRSLAWATGVLLLVVALSPPLEGAADQAASHMVQHLLLGMYAPVLLVLGAPITLLLGVVDGRTRHDGMRVLRSRTLHVLGHPVTAALLHVGGLLALYLTPLYALSLRSDAVHLLVHVHFLLAGTLFAWSVAGPDPAPGRPGLVTRVGVLVAAGAVHSFLAKLLYARAGELPPSAGQTVAESQGAAQWMYYGGDVGELLLAVAVFAGWYRMAGHRHRREARSTAAVGTKPG